MRLLRALTSATITVFSGLGMAWAYCSLREPEWPVDIATLPRADGPIVDLTDDDAAPVLDAEGGLSTLTGPEPLHEPEARVSSGTGHDAEPVATTGSADYVEAANQ